MTSSGTPQASPGPFAWSVRVYYEDTDAAGVVYYANYLKFLERARTEWLRARGLEQDELARSHEVVFVVRAIAAEYLLPARFNDALAVTVEQPRIDGARLLAEQRVLRGETVLLTARITAACVNTRTFRAARIPREVAELLSL
ncbi:MAG: tol-pal system-associated acyl-CoA thioesterase [Burkholderiales bacterium]